MKTRKCFKRRISVKVKNEKKYKKIVCYAIVGTLACSSFFGTISNNEGMGVSKVVYATSSIKKTEQNIDNAEQKKEQLEEKKKALESKIATLEKEKGNILVYIEKLDKQLEEIEKDMADLNAKIRVVDAELIQTEQELEEAILQVENQYNSMKLRIKYMYENGDSDYISLLLQSDGFGDFLSRTEYIAKISEYDKKCYENYIELKQKVEDTKAKLEERKAELATLKEELAYEEQTVTKLSNDKAVELAKYEEKIDEADSEAEAFQQEIEKQEELIEDLLEQRRKQIEEEERRKEEERKKREEEERKRQEALQAQQNSSSSSSSSNSSSSGQVSTRGFVWPLSISGRITSRFGYRKSPTKGASTYHKGIDVGAATGTPILATQSGKVVTATYSSSAGYYVMIYHGNSTYSVYMHCSSLNVSVGQQVSKGQTIAKVGSTGISTGPHLHFGISVNGSYVNPLNYVSQ